MTDPGIASQAPISHRVTLCHYGFITRKKKFYLFISYHCFQSSGLWHTKPNIKRPKIGRIRFKLNFKISFDIPGNINQENDIWLRLFRQIKKRFYHKWIAKQLDLIIILMMSICSSTCLSVSLSVNFW